MKAVVKTKKWTIEHIIFEDGTSGLSRTNDGFNSFELIGLLEISKDDIIKQIKGEIKPDVVNRTLIVEDNQNK